MILHLERKFTSPTETFIANQINFQTKYKSTVFTVKHLNSLEINAEVFESPGNSMFSGSLLTQEQVNLFIDKANKTDLSLIHGHFLTDAAFFTPFSKKLAIPKVCSGYGYDVSNFPRRYFGLAKLYFKKLFREYNALIAMSNDMADDLVSIGCPKQKIVVHYHGINTLFFDIVRDYNDHEVFNILTIASLVGKKGHSTVLKSLKKLRADYPNFKFHYWIVGSGPLLAPLNQYIISNNLKDHVTFLGLIKHGPELLDLIKKADIFLHPSRVDTNGGKEGIPGTIVEAMASGLPIISTYHAGIPDIITNRETGLLVNEDDANAIANLIYECHKDKDLRSAIGRNAKRTATHNLDVRNKTEELIKIYDTYIR